MGAEIALKGRLSARQGALGRAEGRAGGFPLRQRRRHRKRDVWRRRWPAAPTVITNAAREPEIVDLAECADPDGGRGSTAPAPGRSRSRASTVCMARPIRSSPTGSNWAPTCWPPGPGAAARVEMPGRWPARPWWQAFADKLDEAGIEVTETAAGLKVRAGATATAEGGERHHRTLPRFSDRSAGPDDGDALHRQRHQRAGRDDLREPLHARARTDAHGRRDRGAWRQRHGPRGRTAERRAG